ncbi:RadC family protein [Acholeplasma granularum]|uniref:RadC family protein n=1 Tax=Acholeplasma granularum TaxID=264635 RepID=UPI0004BB03BD|nr:DNA repair protein RadC [Acholeplasma granularum]
MKPREKLIKYGAKSLLNEELVAILLRTGTQNKPVIQLAKEVLELLENITDLKVLSVEDLMTIKGISNAKATSIIASVELIRRIDERKEPKKLIFKESKDIYYLLKEDMTYLNQEHLKIICVDVKGKLIKIETLYIGTNNYISVSIKELFKTAIKLSAYGIILVHNHPSGDATPSLADDELTSRVEEASEILNITLVDHIIIGKNQFYSYRGQRRVKV